MLHDAEVIAIGGVLQSASILGMTATLHPVWTVGDRLRKARSGAGISCLRMAAELEVDRSAITRWENDHTEPRRAVLMAYAMLTGVDLAWIEGGNSQLPTYLRAASSRRHLSLVGVAA